MGFGFKDAFDLLDFEKLYATFETSRRNSGDDPFALSASARTAEDKRLLAISEAGRLIELKIYRARLLSERQHIANSGVVGLNVQGFLQGATPEFSTQPGAYQDVTFVKPPFFLKRDVKATLTITQPTGGVKYTQEFILTRVQREANERYQILATFGGFDLIMYGSDPVICTCNGHIFDGKDVDGNWYNRFWDMYQGDLKGSMSAQKNNRIQLYYSGRMIEGVILKVVLSEDASPGHLVDFSWVMLILSDIEIVSGETEKSKNTQIDIPAPHGTLPNIATYELDTSIVKEVSVQTNTSSVRDTERDESEIVQPF